MDHEGNEALVYTTGHGRAGAGARTKDESGADYN